MFASVEDKLRFPFLLPSSSYYDEALFFRTNHSEAGTLRQLANQPITTNHFAESQSKLEREAMTFL